jgi:hypothetical protein
MQADFGRGWATSGEEAIGGQQSAMVMAGDFVFIAAVVYHMGPLLALG